MPPQRLPNELIGHILRFLHPDVLPVAAAVSRGFNRQAWRAGLIIKRTLIWTPHSDCATRLTALSEVVVHAVNNNLRLALILTVQQLSPADAPGPVPPASDVLLLIPVALPILVRLSVVVCGPPAHSIAGVLCHHAPHLQTLDLRIYSCSTQGDDSITVIPPNLFNRDAPKLRHVTLEDIQLPRDPIAALAGVVSLTLQGAVLSPDVVLVQHFPSLRWLLLSDRSDIAAPTTVVPYNLHGAQLEWLVIVEPIAGDLMSVLLCGESAVNVPNVVYRCEKVKWEESHWPRTSDGPFSIRLTAIYSPTRAESSTLVVPAHQRWFRGYVHRVGFPYHPVSITDLPGLSKRLTYLRVDHYFVLCFLECTDIALEALSEMQIDCKRGDADRPQHVHFGPFEVSPPTFFNDGYGYVHCPSLKTLRLFAMYKDLSVVSLHVAYIGRALSQCIRPKQNRAALELHGVQLASLVPCELLEEVYSTVRQFEFAGCDSPVGADSGLWDIAYSCPFP